MNKVAFELRFPNRHDPLLPVLLLREQARDDDQERR